MKKEMIVLEFVNDEKPFEPVNWTTELQLEHDDYMAELSEKKKIDSDDSNFGQYSNDDVILRSLKLLFPKVTVKDLRTLHPRDYLDLRDAVYNSGRRGIRPTENFRKLQNDPE